MRDHLRDFDSSGVCTPDELDMMQTVFRSICDELDLGANAEARRALAEIIVGYAVAGVREQESLREQSIGKLRRNRNLAA